MNRTVIVTGAAAGIGFAIASRLSSDGWCVGMIDLSADELERAKAKLGDREICIAVADVTDTTALAAAFETIASRFGEIHAVINNAGILRGGPFQTQPLSDHHQQLAVNANGVINGSYIAFPYLSRASGKKHLINICSVSAIHGTQNLAVYSASKAFVKHFSEALSLEWEEHSIAVHAIWPPVVGTAMVEGEGNPMVAIVERRGIDMGPEGVAEGIVRILEKRHRNAVHLVQTPSFNALRLLRRLTPYRLFRKLYKSLS